MAGSTRRSFIDHLLSTSLGATVLSIAYPVILFLIPPALSESQQNNVLAGTSNELKPNSAKIFKFGSRPGILVRTSTGEFRALSTCPPFILRIEFVVDVQLQAVACSETGHSLKLFGISRAMHRNL